VIVVVVGVLGVGWSLPVGYRVSRSAEVPTRPDSVYALLTDVAAYPRWRTGVSRVEFLPGPAGRLRYVVQNGRRPVTYEMTRHDSTRRVVTRLADTSLARTGRWTFEIRRTTLGTHLRVTEDAEVYNPARRFFDRFVRGYSRRIDEFLADVVRRFSLG